MKPYPRILFFLLLLFAGNIAHGQLTAGFTASTTSGCAPLLVSFTNTTTGPAGTTYSWTFGTTGSSIYTNPSTSFTTPGTHLVTLTATNGSSVSTHTMTITVFPPPTVSFVASDTTVCPGTSVTFTSTSTPGAAGAMTYAWAFGDGGTDSGSPVSHSYSTSGHFTTTLYVTNTTTNCVASLVRTLFVEVSIPPVAIITGPSGACNPPASISFSGTSSSGVSPISYSWFFGDGGTGTGPSPSHTYTATGFYTMTLTVTDGNGCTSTTTRGVNIGTIAASFTHPDTACVFAPVTFTNTSTPHSVTSWTFGDGGSSPSYHGTHTYSAPGTYTVTLTITNPPCTHSVAHTIVILPGPSTDFTIAPVHPCPAPESITYTGTGPAGTLYTWLLEGGVTLTGNPVTHTYGTNGIKTIRMIEVNPLTGCRDTVTKTDTLYDLDFQAFGSPDEGCVPLTVTFGGNAYTHIPAPGTFPYPLPITTWSWDFGDGSASGSGATPTHTYTAVGIYTATVNAVTANGCPVTDVVVIEVGEPPEVTFTASPLRACYGAHTPIIFTVTIVNGPVDEYHWSFGDAGGIIYDTSAPPMPVAHVYTVPGIFDVTVTPYYRGCPGIPYTITDYITIDSPKSIIGDSIYCSPRTRVKFTNLSLGDDSHEWIFGDGNTSTLDNPIHDYPATGTYVVRLATYNAASGCRDTAFKTIILAGPVPDFTASSTAICRGQSITFTSTTTLPGYVTNYYWRLDGVTVPGATNTTYIRNFSAFTDTGYHSVSLVIRNVNGCLDTIHKPNYIRVGSPNVNFNATPLTGCAPLNVTFTDASTAVSGTSLVAHFWRFGDATSASGNPVSHVYNTAGSFTVWHRVTDNIGCVDSFPRTVTVYKPVASFVASNIYPCIGAPVTFTNTTPSLASSIWDFGDGGSSTLASPAHTYSAVGSYNVKLTITDTHGCTDDTTYTAYINVTRPAANFTMSDSVSVCPPLTVNFTNTSTGATTYNWELGDGSFSIVTNPSNLYIVPNLYTVQLIATNVHGCKDTMQRFVNIFGYAGAFSYSPLQGCAPLTVHFVATLSNVPFITWDFSDGVTSTTSYLDTISHTYTTPGAYVPKLLLSDNSGCQASSVGLDTIKVDAVFPKFTTFPNPVCIGMEFNLIDSSSTYWSPITNWDWTYDGLTSTLTSPAHTINTPGTYPIILKVTNGWGCVGIATGDIIIDPPPIVTASPDTIVCVGDPATLFGYGALTYTWDPPSTLSCTACNPTNATPTVVTTYTVTGADKNGCIDTATVTVGLRTHTDSRAWGDTAVCQGVSVQLFDTGGTTYLWIPSAGLNNPTIYNPIATPNFTTLYTVVAKLAGCIADTNTVLVTIYPIPSVDAGPDQRLVAGSTAQLNATGTDIASYMWSPSETLSCIDCPNPVASMTVMTTYNVDVVSPHGCRSSDSVTIKLFCDNSQIFIPNAFTPNGDGQNDVFYPRGIGVKVIRTFRIYNRWGELLFEREGINLNDVASAWDGTYKGDIPHPDVYVYIMEALCYTGEEITIKGDVTIIR